MTTKKVFFYMTIIVTLISCRHPANSGENIRDGQSLLQAKQLTIENLNKELQNLSEGKTEYDFFGITSNGTDCIYFVRAGDKFVIEFEVMSEEQKDYLDKVKDFAKSINCNFIITTYNNQPQYKSDSPAPVIRLETNSTLEKTSEIGFAIQSKIFGNNKETVYDIVP